MSKFTLLALLAVGCGGSPAPAPATEAPPAEAPAAEAPAAEAPAAEAPAADAGALDGKALYEANCQTCHQADGTGMVGETKLAGNYKERLHKSDDELFNSIKNGKTGEIGAMPPWGPTLSDDQIKAVLAYVRATYGDAAAAPAEGAPAEGAAQ